MSKCQIPLYKRIFESNDDITRLDYTAAGSIGLICEALQKRRSGNRGMVINGQVQAGDWRQIRD